MGGGGRTGDQGAAERLRRSSEPRVQRVADLTKNGQESQRQTRGNDPECSSAPLSASSFDESWFVRFISALLASLRLGEVALTRESPLIDA